MAIQAVKPPSNFIEWSAIKARNNPGTAAILSWIATAALVAGVFLTCVFAIKFALLTTCLITPFVVPMTGKSLDFTFHYFNQQPQPAVDQEQHPARIELQPRPQLVVAAAEQEA